MIPLPEQAPGGGNECKPPPWTVAFYCELMLTGSVAEAVRAAGIEPADAWELRRSSPEFAAYWDKSVDLYRSAALPALVAGAAPGEQLH